jgi:hypothetical protein
MTDVSLEWATNLPTIEVAYEGEQTGLVDFYGELSARRKEFGFVFDDQHTDGRPLSLQHLDEFADAVTLRVIASWNERDVTALRMQIDSPVPEAITLDDDDLLPWLTDGRLDLTEAERPVARWSGDTGSTDGVRIQFVYYWPDNITPQSWFACVEPGGDEFRFPQLPESFAAYRPTSGARLSEDGNFMAALENDAIDGYAEFRRMHCLDFWRTIDPDEREFVERHDETRLD